MNNEIKEILDKLDFNEWEVDLYKVPITWAELYDIRDYITNLQEENKNLKFILSGHWEESYNNSKIVSVDTYKSRNEKAIEHIDLYINRLLNNDIAITPIEMRYLKNILQGEDKDE